MIIPIVETEVKFLKEENKIRVFVNGKYDHTKIKVKDNLYKKWGKEEYMGCTNF